MTTETRPAFLCLSCLHALGATETDTQRRTHARACHHCGGLANTRYVCEIPAEAIFWYGNGDWVGPGPEDWWAHKAYQAAHPLTPAAD